MDVEAAAARVVAGHADAFGTVVKVIDGDADQHRSVEVGVGGGVGHLVERRLHIGSRTPHHHRRGAVAGQRRATLGNKRDRAVGCSDQCRGNRHLNVIGGALSDVDCVTYGKPAVDREADAAAQRLIGRDAQRRLVVDRHQGDGVIDHCGLLAVCVREIGDRRAQVEIAVANARIVVVRRSGELEIVQRHLHFGQRSGQRDRVAAVAGGRGQPAGRAEDQSPLRAGIGQRRVSGVAVELDGYRDILVETIGVGQGKTGKRQLRILVHRVGAGIADRRRIVEVGCPQCDILADAIVGRIHGAAVGVERSRAAVGADGQRAGIVTRAIVGRDADLVIARVGVATKGDGQRSQDGVDLGLATLHDQ